MQLLNTFLPVVSSVLVLQLHLAGAVPANPIGARSLSNYDSTIQAREIAPILARTNIGRSRTQARDTPTQGLVARKVLTHAALSKAVAASTYKTEAAAKAEFNV